MGHDDSQCSNKCLSGDDSSAEACAYESTVMEQFDDDDAQDALDEEFDEEPECPVCGGPVRRGPCGGHASCMRARDAGVD